MEASIYTRRLHLRMPDIADAGAIFRGYATDTEVTRYLSWRPHKSQRCTIGFLQRCQAGWKGCTEFSWVLEMASPGVVGMIDIHDLSDAGGALGFVLARRFWGRSLMTEAARAVASMARADRVRLRSYVHPDNQASIRVLEKAGLERVGICDRVMFLPNLGTQDLQPGLLFEEPQR